MNAVIPDADRGVHRSHKLLTILAFLSIYIIWGSTYFAIRVAVATVPPLLAAGARFVLAGLLMFAYVLVRRMPLPSAIEWRNLALSGLLLFVPAYGGLFWAEKTVPSGIASALVATIPVWMAIMEVFVLRQTKLRWQLIASIACGIGGVSLLTLKGNSGGSHALLPYLVMLMSQVSWSIGTLMTKNMQLPSSEVVSSATQMGIGGLPAALLALLKNQKQNLRRYHPKLQMRVSPQSFGEKQLVEFIRKAKSADWLDGVVHGPQCRGSLPELRAKLRRGLPIRLYPDVTHSLQCQFPVAAAIARQYLPPGIGFISYSEGCNDDVNKFIWSSAAWDSNSASPAVWRNTRVISLVRQSLLPVWHRLNRTEMILAMLLRHSPLFGTWSIPPARKCCATGDFSKVCIGLTLALIHTCARKEIWKQYCAHGYCNWAKRSFKAFTCSWM